MRYAHGSVPHGSGRGLRAHGLLAAAAGLTVVLATGCSGSSNHVGAVSSTVTIAAMPGVDTAPLYLAQEDGMFAAEGLSHVVIDAYSSETAELSAVASGRADIAASDYGDIFYEQDLTHDLRILSDGYDAAAGVLEVLTYPTSPITSPAKLANQRIAVPDNQLLPGLTNSSHPVSLDAAATTEVLANYIADAQGSVTWVPMSEQQEVAGLANHTLDAAVLSEPYIYEAESQFGATVVFDACSGSTSGLPLTGYVATDNWVKANPVAAADFQAAMTRAQTQAAMAGEVATILPKTAGMTTEDADLSTVGIYPTSTNAVNLERVVQIMSDFDMIKSLKAPSVPLMIVRSGS